MRGNSNDHNICFKKKLNIISEIVFKTPPHHISKGGSHEMKSFLTL